MDIETRLNIIKRLCYKYQKSIFFLGFTIEDFAHELYSRYKVVREEERPNYLNYNIRLRIIDTLRIIGGRPGDSQKNRHPVLYDHQFHSLKRTQDYSIFMGQLPDTTIEVDNEDYCDYLISCIGNHRDKQILKLYFYKSIQMKEIAKIYNLSESMVSRIIGDIINIFKGISYV